MLKEKLLRTKPMLAMLNVPQLATVRSYV
jgi:hypothetical protein